MDSKLAEILGVVLGVAAWILLYTFIGCGADVTVHGVPKEIKLTTGCTEPVDAGVE